MENKFKIGTWNVCLGLANQKDMISEIIVKEKIDVCCLQEVDIPASYNSDLLSFRGYSLLIEKNDIQESIISLPCRDLNL